MISENLRKNRVQFNVGVNFDTVTLISHPCFLEVVISRRANLKAPIDSVCAHVRSTITSTLNTVTSNLNYHFKMESKFGFECTSHPGKRHICILESPVVMRCLQDPHKTELVSVEPRHQVWLSNLCCNNATCEGT